MKEQYKPKSIDVKDVLLSEELLSLVETLSKNTHEIWAQSKIKAGWSHGAEFDKTTHTHPSIIPYELLSEEEKDYDRHTTLGVIKTLLKLGYSIKKES